MSVDGWAIVCIVIVLYHFFKPKPEEDLSRNTVKNRWARERRKGQRNLDNQRKQEADDLITMIIPTINNDGK